ncbi:MAG TPA: TonB-dependent receptor [bacterium]|jgi:hypothetical protein|nr:TonB-dependent receptor [bacterium]
MKLTPCALLLLAGLALPPLLSADAAPSASGASTPEALVGEDRGVPTALPTPEADAGGPLMLSRSAQAAPSFALPAFVITGGGERQDLEQRGDLGTSLDTSGGIKTSPGETGAGQDQRATEAVRAAPQDETFTPTQHYGELTASYGLGNTLKVDGMLAGEQGPWYGWLDGGTHFSDGGPLPSSALEPAQRYDGSLDGKGGWRMDPGDLFEAAADGAWRSLRLTSFGGDSWEQRSQGGASLDWEGDWLGLTPRIQVQGREAQIGLPGYSYSEESGGLEATAEKSLGGALASALLDGGLDLGLLDQRGSFPGRSLENGAVWAEVHLEPWSGGRLGLGFRLDWDLGPDPAVLPGPMVEFEQRLARDLGLRLEFGTRIDVSSLAVDGFQTDPLLPNARLLPSRRVADFKAALPWAPAGGLSLEAGAFVRQDVNAFLPDPAAQPGLWTDATVGTLRVEGFSLSGRREEGPWWQSLEGVGQTAADGVDATFLPHWKGSAALGWKAGPWSAETGLKVQSTRLADLQGSWTIPAQWDWTLKAGFDVNDHLRVFLEGDSLAGAVTEWPGYDDAAPYLGLGAKLLF